MSTDHVPGPGPGGRMQVCLDGPADAAAVVLVHGLGASGRSWEPLTSLLAPVRRVIRVDLSGHGRSAPPADGDYGIPAHAARVAGVLDRLDVTEAAIVGHSTGGAVAVSLLEQRPDLATALVVVNTGPGLHALIAPDIAVDASAWPHLTDAQIRAAMGPAFSRVGYEVPQEIVDDVRAVSYEAFTGTLRGSHDYLRERALPDRLRDLEVPTLVIVGADDRRWRSSAAADYRVVAGTRVELLAGLGHSPMLEDPPRVADPLLTFLGRSGRA